jgi:hypothetical protein
MGAGCSRPEAVIDPTTAEGRASECAAVASQAAQFRRRGLPFQHAVLRGFPRSREIAQLVAPGPGASRTEEWIAGHLDQRLVRALIPQPHKLHPPTSADWRDYEAVLAQRVRYLSAYEQDLDCTKEFRAAGIKVDPGGQAREQFLLSGALRDAGALSYSREIIAPNGATWAESIYQSCRLNSPLSPGRHDATNRFVTDISPCSGTARQSILHMPQNKWTGRPLGNESCEAIIRYAYHTHCP